MSEKEYIQSFSNYLFWDVNPDSIDLETNAAYVIRRILERGQIEDWRLLVDRYGLSEIVRVAKNLRSLEPRALSFINAVSSSSEELYKCSTTKQSDRTQEISGFELS